MTDTTQPAQDSLFDVNTDGDRDGATFDRERDGVRLNAQHKRVFGVVRDGTWHTLEEIAKRTGDPEASVSARLRDFRKPKFGGLEVERRYLADGLWMYRLKDEGV